MMGFPVETYIGGTWVLKTIEIYDKDFILRYNDVMRATIMWTLGSGQTEFVHIWYDTVASGPIVLFTCNVLAMSILVPLSTVNISTTSNCQCPIVRVAVVFRQF